MNKLNDQILKNVTGGGSGVLPPGGLTYTVHSGIVGGRFYADVNKSSQIIYAIQPNDTNLIDYYKLTLEVKDNNWRIIEPNALITRTDPISEMNGYYPYLLNILP